MAKPFNPGWTILGLAATLPVLGQPEAVGIPLVTAVAVACCGGIVTWLRRGYGVEAAPEGLTLLRPSGEMQVNWDEVVGVAGRAAAGTLRIQTPERVHLVGCVARTSALIRLLRQVMRLNARNPDRATALDVPAGALSRAPHLAPQPSDAALSQVTRRER